MDPSKALLRCWSMDDATDQGIKFSLTEQGEESKTTLIIKLHQVQKPFQKLSGQKTNRFFEQCKCN